MKNYALVDDADVPDDVIIPDNTWALKFDNDVIVVINYIQIAQEENEDGSITLSIDYDVKQGDPSAFPDFDKLIGDTVADIIEDLAQLDDKREEYKDLLKQLELND